MTKDFVLGHLFLQQMSNIMWLRMLYIYYKRHQSPDTFQLSNLYLFLQVFQLSNIVCFVNVRHPFQMSNLQLASEVVHLKDSIYSTSKSTTQIRPHTTIFSRVYVQHQLAPEVAQMSNLQLASEIVHLHINIVVWGLITTPNLSPQSHLYICILYFASI